MLSISELQKCFIEEAAPKKVTIGDYKNPDLIKYNEPYVEKKLPIAGFNIIVTDENNQTVFSSPAKLSGRFAFTAHSQGEYKICIKSNITGPPQIARPGEEMRFYIHFHNYDSNGDDNMSEFARKEQLTKLTEKVNELREKSKKTIQDQKEQRKVEEGFRESSNDSNSYIVFWSVLQILFLIGVAVCQISYLRAYFIKKKIA